MKTSAFVFVVLTLWLQVSFAEKVEVKVNLSPAGNFVIKTDAIEGVAQQKNNQVYAKDIKVDLRTLKTGIALRDDHTKDKLNVQKFPFAILKVAKGADGQGEGILVVKGVEKKISGTYIVDKSILIAKFKLSLKDFGIQDVKYLGVGAKDTIELKVQIPMSKT